MPSVMVSERVIGIGSFDIDYEPDWTERDFQVPASLAGERTRIELRVSGGVVTTFHYWFVPN